ncbi:hypothetical protein N657DRAFT_687754 [Parathielavia appendiculata]|uniref:Protein transport protein sec16 n=1 Tax=Parathielavia appendiculata TaxID=2587402 RepID=A0AAN6U6V9_9PEZI|nr:hypothetical protein N657DRAFT_687754 [Parathielavia appendiculata]
MVSEAPNSSWHPAMMPNSTADLPRDRPHNVVPSPVQETVVAEDSVQPSTGAWFQHDDADDEWLADNSNAPDPPTKTAEQAALAESVQDSRPDESSAPNKHFSTMSFTRTVPHEVNWNDDDEVEWTLPKTATDPFKFMPESNRTNSFPPVSVQNDADETRHELEQPISFNQAEDMIREIEEEESREEGILPEASTAVLQAGAGAQETWNAGSDATVEDTLDARFEEGVPLVSSAKQDAAQQGSLREGDDIFTEPATGEEDDFFRNVRHDESNQVEDDGFQPAPLERKSTMDVLQSLDMGPIGASFVPLEATAEELETESETPQPQKTIEPPTQGPENTRDLPKAEEGEALDSKWKAILGDDDDEGFLPDEESETNQLDPTAFLGSDDEGLLEDSDAEQPEPAKPAASAEYVPAVNGQYAPQHQIPAAIAPPTNPYLPTASPVVAANSYFPAAPAPAAQPPVASPYAVPSTAPPAQYVYGAPSPLQEKNKAQSFVNKAKGGYTSPFDLPMEVVKVPKRRTSAQPLQGPVSGPSSPATVPPPPRSTSMYSHPPPPSSMPGTGVARPGSSHSSHAPPSANKSPSHEKFFEELPIATKPRPASRQSQKSMPSPSQPSPYGPPPSSAPPSATSNPGPFPRPLAPSRSEAGIPELVAPPLVNPYASLSSAPGLQPAVAPVASTRYSPALPGAPHAPGPVPAIASSRYSPAPPASRPPSSGYVPVPATPGPPILPHQPRTSSPLAHFELNHERTRAHAPVSNPEGALAERRSSSSLHEFRLQRIPSLPPTKEVEEEEPPAQARASPGVSAPPQPASPPVSRYAPPPQARQTPPPSAISGQTMLSPPKRAMSSHSPVAPPYDSAPPARSQTQSPGALYGNRGSKSAEPIPRPSSVNDPTSPRGTAYAPAAIVPTLAPAAPVAAPGRPRGASLNLDVIPPTDGREHDPLQRWRGAPLISWGVGGTVATMFPKEVPRYGMNQSIPTVVRSPGEVRIQNVKDIIPFEERLAKFPGPLKGKSKKKETIAWLTAGIESLEQGLPTNLSVQPYLSHEDKRAVERVLLWKILRVFVEHDGVLEGNPAVEKAVRSILSPELEGLDHSAPYLNGGAPLGFADLTATGLQSDGVSSSTIEQIRRHLLSGECEKAIWAAADQRLWGHALLLSNALAPNLYKQVAQEFIKKEVNFSGHGNESLAALYGVLSGNHEESVDELVPSHARAGFQLVATNTAAGASKDAMEGLDKWRETLSLILSNRSIDDVRAINSLGVLLSGYGRAEAAHICFMFARSYTVFGGLDDPASHFVLVGSDHKKQAEQFAKEIEPLLLSEVYEYGQILAGSSTIPVSNPHLAAYKLQHALALAEYGFRDKALQYCDAIAAAITAQTKRSPYHHPILEMAVEDLMRRLKQAPREESSSWIPKPSMNKVSDTVWSKFNKFVSGDDEASGQGSPVEGESGPFARVAGGTPTISRSPSLANLETFGAAVPNYGMPAPMSNGPVPVSAPPTRAASRYAPGAPPPAGSGSRPSTSAYAPRSSLERTSGELSRGSFELPRRSLEMPSGRTGNHSPVRSGSPAALYTPYGSESNVPQQSPYRPTAQSAPPHAPASAPPQALGYPGAAVNGEPSAHEAEPSPQTSSYQPPSYGYEPPSSTPYEAPAEEKSDASDGSPNGGSYEPPSYQPYGYEPPSYEPESQPADQDGDSNEEAKPKPKKKGIMYDDDDDNFPLPRPAEKSKEEKDRENAEMFRKAAEEDAKRAEAAKQAKKGWGLTSLFFGGGGTKKEAAASQDSGPKKPIRAKLGEANSFYYDPELKRWVNKNAGPEEAAKKATPPPPKATPRSVSSSPGLPPQSASVPPSGPPRSMSASLGPPMSSSDTNLPSSNISGGGGGGGVPPPPAGPVSMLRSVSNTSSASAPQLGQGPARPPTSLSNSSSIDDLLGAVGPRKAGAKKVKKGARYVDVMGKS